MATTETVIVAVQIQPIAQSGRGSVKPPITRFCIAINMITTISGTATTPLSTATQNSALIGWRSKKLTRIPAKAATAREAAQSGWPFQGVAERIGGRSCQHWDGKRAAD